jgi:hypothetical protein
LNIQGEGDVRQTDIESFVPEPSISDVEVAIYQLERYKSPGSDHISAEVFQARGEGWGALQFDINKLIKLILSKEELPHQ